MFNKKEKEQVDAYELSFEPGKLGADRYAVVYAGWYFSFGKLAKGPDGVALGNALGTKLRLVSDPGMPAVPALEIRVRKLKERDVPLKVLLTPGEFALLRSMVELADPDGGPEWTAEAGLKAAEAMTWLKSLTPTKVSAAALEHP